MQPVHVTALCNDGHLALFREVIELLYYGLLHAGASVHYAPRSMRREALNLVFAAHRIPPSMLPQLLPDRVIVNLEQVCDPKAWQVTDPQTYRTILGSSAVLDYSERNRAWLARELGVAAELLRFGHVPELERIPWREERDIDVLFYGNPTPWREHVLQRLEASGLHLLAITRPPWCYGPQRDALIARSRVVLNLHQHHARILELPRVNYLLVNGRAVVSEAHPDTEMPPPYGELVEQAATPDGLVDRCRELVYSDARRRRCEERAREAMRGMPQAPIMAGLRCLVRALPTPAAHPRSL